MLCYYLCGQSSDSQHGSGFEMENETMSEGDVGSGAGEPLQTCFVSYVVGYMWLHVLAYILRKE